LRDRRDSILAAFGSALAAVQCAVDIQNELAHSNNALEKDRRMQFRIGINVGDVMVKEEDIFGDGVNIAARLEGLARWHYRTSGRLHWRLNSSGCPRLLKTWHDCR
jgi:class 3 adenylate cyclase